MPRFWASLSAPLLSLIALVIGSSLFMTDIAIRLRLEGYSNLLVGLMTTSYYGGMALGSVSIERYISRIGHIRAFSAFCALLTALILFQGIYLNAFAWLVSRFISGFTMAGMYVIIESWLLNLSEPKNRGFILAVYMTVFYGAQSLSQLMLNLKDPSSLDALCITAIFTALAIFPVAITRYPSPPIHEPSILNFFQLYKISPLSVTGCFLSGIILGAFYGLGPVFAKSIQLDTHQIGQYMSITIFGGMLLQYPIGHLSDRFERRKFILGTSIAMCISALFIALFAKFSYSLLLFLSLIYGGAAFTLYPLCISHATDYLTPKDLIAATGGLLLAYGLGATIGPLLAPSVMYVLGSGGLYYFLALMGLTLAGFAFWRTKQRPPLPINEQTEYVGFPSTTPIANELDPRAEQQHETRST